jgi:hypothetical protein
VRHGATSGVDPAVWLTDDPDLALVQADMGAWAAAHDAFCECDGVCVCDDEQAA